MNSPTPLPPIAVLVAFLAGVLDKDQWPDVERSLIKIEKRTKQLEEALLGRQREIGTLHMNGAINSIDAARWRIVRDVPDDRCGSAGIPVIAVPSSMHGGTYLTGADADSAADAAILAAALIGPQGGDLTPWTRDDEATMNLLRFVDVYVTTEMVAEWSDEQVQLAEEWASAVHFHASDNHDVVVPLIPSFLVGLRT